MTQPRAEVGEGSDSWQPPGEGTARLDNSGTRGGESPSSGGEPSSGLAGGSESE